MVDLCDIMENYGAYNAANLDGGSSSELVIRQKIITILLAILPFITKNKTIPSFLCPIALLGVKLLVIMLMQEWVEALLDLQRRIN